ncbi:uncharacterized protein [Ptychodera flava]|uniref:uncharacterized protein n=1 Tax=Ptychodera flava TaxID=63121 RepID=UPI00396A57B8
MVANDDIITVKRSRPRPLSLAHHNVADLELLLVHMAANIRTVELQQLLVALFDTRRGEELFHVFLQEQVLDKETVSLMTDESLKAMGLKAGEIARLKVEVAKDEKKKNVVDLIEQIRLKNVKKGNARKFKGQRVTHPVAKKQHCKVNIGWLHSENGQTFKQVRLQDGGGTRILDFPSSDLVTVDSIKQRSLKVFAKGIAKFLSADSVTASVGNFNREEIDDFKTIDGEMCDFTEYLKSHGLYASKIKLYLLTQPNLSLLDNRKDTSMTESDERVEQTKKVTEASSTCTLSDMPSISDIGPSTPNVSPHISASTPAMGSDMPSIPEGGPSTPAMRSDMPSIPEGGPSTPAMRSDMPSIPGGGPSTPAMRSDMPSYQKVDHLHLL